MRMLLSAAISLGLGLVGTAGSALEAVAQGTTEILTSTDGDPSSLGAGTPQRRRAWSPGGMGNSGTYSVVDAAPSNVTIAGDTEVLDPPAQPAAAPANTIAGCNSYAGWYDARVAYEAAGMTTADPAVVAALDPDYDGIACEEGM